MGFTPNKSGRNRVSRMYAMRVSIIKGLFSDKTLKQVAMEIGVSHTTLPRWASNLGFRRMYVTDCERRALMATRRADGKVAV